jgi:hypothetical protein
MAIKKSDLYSSLWASCDELRGNMDASQYKDYVFFMLFIKYVSDKYGDSEDFAPSVVIPKGARFKDMVALKGIQAKHTLLPSPPPRSTRPSPCDSGKRPAWSTFFTTTGATCQNFALLKMNSR